MRRADRLFQIVQLLRRGGIVTAARLAVELEISERTVYRDVQDLVLSGVPIDGEAGVGYALRKSFDLPPLMFDAVEIEALVLGARMVESWSDAKLARAARNALAKIEVVLPERLRARVSKSALYAPGFHVRQDVRATLETAREALEARRVLACTYVDERSGRTSRRVRPLALSFWGKAWTLTGWCELRLDFRSFRIDRLTEVEALDETFEPEPGRRLEDFFASLENERAQRDPSRATNGGDAGHVVLARSSRTGRPTTGRDESQKAAKLPLSDPERRALRKARITLAEIGDLADDELFRRTGGAIGPERCAELVSLAAFQRLGSIGLECARDLVRLGLRRIEDLRGKEPVELYERLCRVTRARQDPCVEDVLRCAIAQAEDEDLPPADRAWWRWSTLRGRPRTARPSPTATPEPPVRSGRPPRDVDGDEGARSGRRARVTANVTGRKRSRPRSRG